MSHRGGSLASFLYGASVPDGISVFRAEYPTVSTTLSEGFHPSGASIDLMPDDFIT
jgi:hypothetical protein